MLLNTLILTNKFNFKQKGSRHSASFLLYEPKESNSGGKADFLTKLKSSELKSQAKLILFLPETKGVFL